MTRPDIVQRLRDRIDMSEERRAARICDLIPWDITLLREAAAEIERLRTPEPCATCGRSNLASREAQGLREELLRSSQEVERMREALKTIVTMPEYDQDDAHRLRAKARAALSRVEAAP